MKMTRREVMNLYLSVIRDCLETGISPRCHLEDITRSDIYGFVIPFCVELMKLQDEYKIPIKVRACDTMGYGVNFPGAVIPRSVPGIIYGLTTHAGVPSELIACSHKSLMTSFMKSVKLFCLILHCFKIHNTTFDYFRYELP